MIKVQLNKCYSIPVSIIVGSLSCTNSSPTTLFVLASHTTRLDIRPLLQLSEHVLPVACTLRRKKNCLSSIIIKQKNLLRKGIYDGNSSERLVPTCCTMPYIYTHNVLYIFLSLVDPD